MKILLFLLGFGLVVICLAGAAVLVAGFCINAFANFVGGGGVGTDNSP